MRSDSERLHDMLEAIEHIQRYAVLGRDRFDEDELLQTWVVRHLQVIGEAASSLPPSFRDAHPAVPWRDIIGMRQILVHRYFGIDLNAVWSVVDGHLPALQRALTSMLDALSETEGDEPGNERSGP